MFRGLVLNQVFALAMCCSDAPSEIRGLGSLNQRRSVTN